MNKRRNLRTLTYGIFAVLLFSALAPLLAGCGKSATQNAEIPASSFRADPSKMTAADKVKLEQLMKGSGSPPAPTK